MKGEFKWLVVFVVAFLVFVFSLEIVSLKRERIRAQRDIELEQIEQQNKLERTERRADAWHVPWGGKGVKDAK